MREIVDLKSRPPLRDPILITGIGIRRQGGRTAGRSLRRIADAWGAELVAAIDPDEYLDLTVRRPDINIGGEKLAVTWPEIKIYLASPPGAKQDLLLLIGFEPNFFWPRFIDMISSYAEGLGVKTLISLRSFPSDVPHTRPAPVMINSSDIELELQFGVQSRGRKYEGPTDIAGVLAAKVQSQRWRIVDLSILQPNYFPRMPNAQATLSLIKLFDRALGIQTSRARFEKEARDQVRAIDDGVAGNSETKTAIAELEKRYDASAARMDFLTAPGEEPADLPTGQEILEEVERLFRTGGTTEDED